MNSSDYTDYKHSKLLHSTGFRGEDRICNYCGHSMKEHLSLQKCSSLHGKENCMKCADEKYKNYL